VKFGKNASDTCAVLTVAYGAEAMEKSSVFQWHRLFKGSSYFKITEKKMLITFLDMKGIIHFELIPQDQTLNQAYCVEILKGFCETVYKERGLNFGPMMGFSTMTVLQLTGPSLSSNFWPKIN
jgi:hypothetical protein